ncbi:putative RNA-directed DNA polymerase, eukaryota, reverse transcriptase zinc-binding domain protein, partial [Tanacetum coccineum]
METNVHRPLLESQLFRKLSNSDAAFLESEFSLEEDVDKFNFWNCIRHFETTGNLKKGCNPSFTVLTPKKLDPIGFSNFRPISLIGCVYKVISKLLALRKLLTLLLALTNRPSGRQILDGCLIANEIIRRAKLEDQRLLLFKVDFEKSFDSVNWNFLLDIMRQMGFGLKWINWIASCLSSATISILINGSPSNEFSMERGLRQGDPLSPFLFLIVAEALQVTILNACDKGIFKGVCLANSGNNISLLQFADDALFFREWSSLNASNLINIVRCFKLGSWLKVNLDKSRIFGVGVPVNEVISVASSLGCAHGALPFTYLGLPVGSQMRLSGGWQGIIDRDGSVLKDKFPRLYALEMNKDCKAKERGQVVNKTWIGEWVWRIPPRVRAQDDLVVLSSLLNATVFSNNRCDKWYWSYDTSGCFK